MGDVTENPSRDYHDYFVKDGRFVGAFDDMYRHCDNPWHQDESSEEEDVVLALVKDRPYRRILDLGCGKGRFANRVQESTNAPVVAVDVSPTALQLARTSYESLHVVAARVPPLPFATASFDLVIASHLLWCVLPDLTKLFEEIGRTLTPGGRCLVVQTFYKPGEQRYGNEVIEQPEDLIRLIPFRVVRTVEIDRFSNHKLVALAERD